VNAVKTFDSAGLLVIIMIDKLRYRNSTTMSCSKLNYNNIGILVSLTPA